MAQATTDKRLVTAEELLAMPDDGRRRELVRGEVIEMAPAGEEHGRHTSRLSGYVAVWVAEQELGEGYGAETGFWLEHGPDTVRAPDWAFIEAARLPEAGRGFPAVVPDLVLEVVAGDERRAEVYAKVATWLDAGVKVVWVLWCEDRTLQVWRDDEEIVTLRAGDTLTCEDLLPGFSLPLKKVFR